MKPGCPFCNFTLPPGGFRHTTRHVTVLSFEPLNPVVKGHRLFVPQRHVEHDGSPLAPPQLAAAMTTAERWGADHEEAYNLITSSGAAATMTVPHMHVHYVPRRHGDGLALPWTGQRKAAPTADEPVEIQWIDRTVHTVPWGLYKTPLGQSYQDTQPRAGDDILVRKMPPRMYESGIIVGAWPKLGTVVGEAGQRPRTRIERRRVID